MKNTEHNGISHFSARLLAVLLALVAISLALTAALASAASPNLCPLGTGAGRCGSAEAVAVDQSSGDFYVADGADHRVSVFDAAGHFLSAFGFGVKNGTAELQTCTAATGCVRGHESLFNVSLGPTLAVDNSAGPSAGDLYVLNRVSVGGVAEGAIEKYKLNPATREFEHLLSFASEGTGPGEFSGERISLAVDSAGNLWVGEDERLDEFSEAGAFLTEVPLPGAGQIAGLAVDTDPSSPSFGDFYTFKQSQGEENEVQVVSPPAVGNPFTLTFGGDTTQPLTPPEFTETQARELQAALEALPSIGAGDVRVTSAGNVFHIFFSGSLAATNVELLIASAGTVTTAEEGSAGTPGLITRRKPNGEALETLDSAGHPAALGLDPVTGDLFVSDQVNPTQAGTSASLIKFDPTGAEISVFGSGEIIAAPFGNSLGFGATAARLYLAGRNASTGEGGVVQTLAVPPPGPLPVSGSTHATEIAKTSATLCAEVNSEGNSTTAHFEYVDLESFEREGGFAGPHTVKTTESASIGEDFARHQICQPISSLLPATAYRFRVDATNAATPQGIDGETAEFTALPPAAIDSIGVSTVTADSATLEAEINPLGDATVYHFEYLPKLQYLANGETFAGALQVPLAPAAIGAGSRDVALAQHVQGLQPETTYRFRAVIANAVSEAHGGPFVGPAGSFTTQGPAVSGLPDGRAYELVSPPEKHGAALLGISESLPIQAAADGNAVAYVASAPTEDNPQGASGVTQVLSVHGAAGWSSLDLNPAHEAPVGVGEKEFPFFSSDLSRALFRPLGGLLPQHSPAASEETPYLRTTFTSGDPTAFCTTACYRPLVTGCPAATEPCPPAVEALADVSPGTRFALSGKCPSSGSCGPSFLGATSDLSHVILGGQGADLTGAPGFVESLYEWSAGSSPAEQLRLISVLPDGESANPGGRFGSQTAGGFTTRDAISADGSRVVWNDGSHLYVRLNATEEPTASGECDEADPTKACTLQLDAIQGGPGGAQSPAPHYQAASADGVHVFFTDPQQLTPDSGTSTAGGDLYEYDLEKPIGERLIDLSPETEGEAAAVQGLLPAVSEDGSYVYFVADGVLANNSGAEGERAAPGTCVGGENPPSPQRTCSLYLRHAGTTSFIATLSAADGSSWSARSASLHQLTARVSPDGRWLAFMSQRSLTGYDNRDAVSGERDEEVFLFHAAGEGSPASLVCASCDPSGARPDGVRYGAGAGITNIPLAGGSDVWPASTWLAANIPAWTPIGTARSLYQSRYLSDGGRLFFNSSDALAPADTNGAEDVYQYEPPTGAEAPPPNDSCTTAASDYDPASEGCLSLISSGAAAGESAFLDASETGDDVFFLTTAALVKADRDTSADLYDARVGGSESETAKPVECTGDACQQPAVPPSDATPGSLTFNGAGNVLECPKGKQLRKGKCVTKQQKKSKKKKHKKGSKGKKQKRANSNHGGQK